MIVNKRTLDSTNSRIFLQIYIIQLSVFYFLNSKYEQLYWFASRETVALVKESQL